MPTSKELLEIKEALEIAKAENAQLRERVGECISFIQEVSDGMGCAVSDSSNLYHLVIKAKLLLEKLKPAAIDKAKEE